MWMNEYEVEDAYERFAGREEVPNLSRAVEVLQELVNWTNRNSDGWPYWAKPARAANRLMELVEAKRMDSRYYSTSDLDEADVRKALAPVKAFRTRQGVEFHTGLEKLLRGEN